ncbi:aldo/keto reductase [Novosphingobium mangrovi (ex Huang et al. 2023)]|uniref:Aldo/keto reductase n=1 Tax=Novosphingobium mangrovi (ex Huang et al. 2023) TaxID=2976432 RepID=A0ABT2I0J6_9SPHN|nr:aldo/keto reductase [Novosphingobium mangrovi (ex Huang et al. 2023)]MCT2398188.1 aldo/keto reductase [Novosphingobium mangrovi (ex Huang et al. 2023)]
MATQLDHYRLLGRSGLRVSPLCLGTMTFGVGPDGWGSSDAEAAAMVDTYIDRGGNFIDTADFYGGMGGSEKLLGRLLGHRRERMVISTKYSLTTHPGDPNAAGNHRRNMVRSVEDALHRMGTDWIDLLYLHMWDFRTPVDEILRAFDDLVRSGKVLYIGLSDTPAWQASRMQAIAELRGWSQFCALQISYSLIERTVEREMIPMAAEMGMGVCPWSPLGGGVLTGKYSRADLTPPEPGGTYDRKTMNAATGRLNERNLAIAEETVSVARDIGCSPAQVALAWTLTNPAVCSPVLGARTPAQLEDNLGALDITLDAAHLARLDAGSAVPKVFPMDVLTGPAEGMMFGGVTVEKRG